MKGFFNRILRINLKSKTFQEETIVDSVYETYLGGKGLGIYLLMKENPQGVDPLSPQNKLIFCIGPITDTRIYGSCRHGVFTKSPLTGIFSESYSGGKVAEPMSRTGYDAFILESSRGVSLTSGSGGSGRSCSFLTKTGERIKKISNPRGCKNR